MSNPFKFCMECGSKNLPNSKLCCECGFKFPGFASAAAPEKPKITPKQKVIIAEDYDDQDDENTEIPEMDGLVLEEKNADIYKPTTYKFGEIVASNPAYEGFQRPKPPKMSKKAFQEQWKKEAGNQGRESSTEIN